MKFSLLIFLAFFATYTFAQEDRQNITSIGYVEVMFRDSSEVWAMMWDDFTYEYSDNHSEIIVVEGGSNKKIKYKAKHIDFIQFQNAGDTIFLRRYKSPRGRDHILLNEVHRNGEYTILESPSFVSPIYTYIGFKGEVFSLLPDHNHDFLDFFRCEFLYQAHGQEDNHEMTTEEMTQKLDLYLANCLTPNEQMESAE